MTAQWSDDLHHALHAALTGETQGYYVDFGARRRRRPDADPRVPCTPATCSTFRGATWGRPVDPARHRGAPLPRLPAGPRPGRQPRDRRPASAPRSARAAGGGRRALPDVRVHADALHGRGVGARRRRGSSSPTSPSPTSARRSATAAARSSRSTAGTPRTSPTRRTRRPASASVLDWAEPGKDPHARMLAWYRALVALRRAEPDLRDDDLRSRAGEVVGEDRLVVRRGHLVLLVNLGAEAGRVRRPRRRRRSFSPGTGSSRSPGGLGALGRRRSADGASLPLSKGPLPQKVLCEVLSTERHHAWVSAPAPPRAGPRPPSRDRQLGDSRGTSTPARRRRCDHTGDDGLASGAQAAPTPTAASAHVTTKRVCGTPPPGTPPVTRSSAPTPPRARTRRAWRRRWHPPPVSRPTRRPPDTDPADIQSAYKLGGEERRQDGGDRRRLRRPDGRGRPRRSTAASTACRRARRANGCFKKVNQSGAHVVLPAGRRGLGRGDLARPRHGQRDLPRLQDPPRRGQHAARIANLGAAVNTAAATRASWRSATATAAATCRTAATARTTTTPASRSRRAPATAATAPSSRPTRKYVTAVGGTSLHGLEQPAAGPSPPGRGAGSGCSRYNTALAAASSFDTGCAAAPRPTSPRWPTRRPASPSTTAPYLGRLRRLARLRRHQRLVADHRVGVRAWPATPRGYANAIPYAHPSALFDVTTGSNGHCSPSSSAPPAPAGTGRPGWERRTAPERSEPTPPFRTF